MEIKFSSSVVITRNFDLMKHFYIDILQQEIAIDFGKCLTFKNGFTIWQLNDSYPIAQKMGSLFNEKGNNNLELCFETINFDQVVAHLKKYDIKYLHDVSEEIWGQRTVRFYDPENNLIEIGESIPSFVLRFYNEGMSIEEVAKRTFVSVDAVKNIVNESSKSN